MTDNTIIIIIEGRVCRMTRKQWRRVYLKLRAIFEPAKEIPAGELFIYDESGARQDLAND